MVARRVLYLYLVRILLVTGLVGASIPFWWSSWKFHDHGTWVVIVDNRSSEDGLQIVDGPSGGHHVKIVVVSASGRRSVFLLPYANDVYIMPDGRWFRMGGACASFVIRGDGELGCEQSSGRRWVWGADGKSRRVGIPDLIKAEYKVQGGQVMVKIPGVYP
ncbi:MAG: hypothetical protein HKM02_07525 [Pseudomonadales bacterium]|nr:hypothetical protein [Pseudomonadales bacterium]